MYRRFAIAVLIAAPLAVMVLDDVHPRKKIGEGKEGRPGSAEVAISPPPSPPANNNYSTALTPLATLPPSKADPAPAISAGGAIAPPPRVAPGLIDPPPTGGQAIYVD